MTTIALNMIVGPGEAKDLRRCLGSINAQKNFDEIVIVPTTNDVAVHEVCDEYNSGSTLSFSWITEEHPHGDFAGARQQALNLTTSDYVMWLDADDVIREENLVAIENLLKEVRREDRQNIEVYFMCYDLALDPITLKPICTFLRERIFKRLPKFHWRHRVHELLYEGDWSNIPNAKVNGARITHLPMKHMLQSGARNVKILESEIERGDDSFHNRYFLGRDLMVAGERKRGIEILEMLVADIDSQSPVNLYSIAQDVLLFYAYEGVVFRPSLSDLRTDSLGKIQSWGRVALSFMQCHAEPFMILGDVAYTEGDSDTAEKLWKKAMQQPVGIGMMQNVPYYEELPAQRLADLYSSQGDFEQALYYNKISRSHHNTQEMLEKRRLYLEAMISSGS